MRRLVTLLASLLVLAPACGQEPAAGGGGEAQRFAADLRPLNGSDVEGTARMTLAGNHFVVDIDARGLERNRIHAQHIHGVRDEARAPSCPTSADGLNGGGFVGPEQAERAYGGEVLALEPFPTVARNGRLDWEVTMNVAPDEVRPLERRVLVLRGGSANTAGGGAEYEPDLPVACGEIRPLEERMNG